MDDGGPCPAAFGVDFEASERCCFLFALNAALITLFSYIDREDKHLRFAPHKFNGSWIAYPCRYAHVPPPDSTRQEKQLARIAR